MEGRISASVMSLNLCNIGADVKALEQAGVAYLHFDISDGEFVPKYSLGNDLLKQIRPLTSIPFDIHLMITRPEDKLDRLDFQKGDLVTVHYESTSHLQYAIQKIKDRGADAGLALNPATPLSCAEYALDDISALLIMTVNPGFPQQKLIPSSIKKLTDAKTFLEKHHRTDIQLEAEGDINYENAVQIRDTGVDIFVGDSSGIFYENLSRQYAVLKFKALIKRKVADVQDVP